MISNSLSSYLIISSALFSFGVFGVLMRRNLVAMLISLELILNSVNIFEMNSSLKIRIYGDSCLRKKSVPVTRVGSAERLLIASMIEAMHEHKGIGLAAPQVGINQQIIVIDIGEGPTAMSNPRILKRCGSARMEEGCLSIPGVVVVVNRPDEIQVEYLDENSRLVRRSGKELWARVVLHETDHLHGKLIVDYVGWGQKLKVRRQLKEILKYGKALDPQKPQRPVQES